jgi:hypothetical protein
MGLSAAQDHGHATSDDTTHLAVERGGEVVQETHVGSIAVSSCLAFVGQKAESADGEMREVSADGERARLVGKSSGDERR